MRKSHCTLRILALGAAMLAASAGSAFAASYETCLGEELRWIDNIVTVRADQASFPAGRWRDALQQAVDRFNLNPSPFRYSMTIDSDGVGLNNGQNEVWGSTDDTVLHGAPAVAYRWWTCYWLSGNVVHNMDEVDVIFNYGSPWRWASSESKSGLIRYGGSLRPMQTTAIHELGHGLPLSHVNTEYNVMGTDFEHISVNGSTARAYLGEDAADGAVFLYGLSSTLRQDLGVVHWKYSGVSGEYSDHDKTQLYDSSGAILSNFDDGGETRYRVHRGQTVLAEFTYENNGASTHSNIQVGFYISTNSLITTVDQPRIGGATLTLSPDDVFTFRTSVTIPNNLNSDQDYWLGVIIDDTGSISEMVEWNNATYIPIRVNSKVLTGLSISGPSSVNESSTAAYTATASWDDGTTSTVTPTWSENSSFASISSSGVLSTTSVTSNQSVTVSASYSSGSVTKTVSKLVTIVLSGSPDLVIDTFAVLDHMPETGENILIGATVRNQGNGSSNSTTLRYYRSTDATISTTDTQIGTDPIPSLSPGGSSSPSTLVSISSAGTYWLGACVDAVSGESSTSNNCSTGVQVTVNLTVIAAAPMIAVIGDDSVLEGSPYTGPTPSAIGTQPITWWLETGPSGMTIDAMGVVSWPNPAVLGSPHTIMIKAANVAGFDTESWLLTVTPPHTLSMPWLELLLLDD